MLETSLECHLEKIFRLFSESDVGKGKENAFFLSHLIL